LLGLGSWYLYAAHDLLADWTTPMLFLVLAFVAGALLWLHEFQQTYAGLRLAFRVPAPRRHRQDRAAAGAAEQGRRNPHRHLSCLPRRFRPAAALIDQVMAHGGALDRQSADGFAPSGMRRWTMPITRGMPAKPPTAWAVVAAQSEQQNGAISVGNRLRNGHCWRFGSRLGYGVHGEAVALAERIQMLSHRYHWPLIVVEETRRLADRDFAFLEIDTSPPALRPACSMP